MKVKLRYGRQGLQIEVDDKHAFSLFRTKDMPVVDNAAVAIRGCLEKPIGTSPLWEIARGSRDACIVVSDITRPVPNKMLMPAIIESLEAAGLPSNCIRLLVATGIHRPPTREELIEMLGDNILEKYQVLSHDARNRSEIKRIGHTSRGTPIDVNRLYVESDLKVVTGLVEPHFMAGYSGGRKSIAVGLTSVDAIKYLHGTKFLEHPGSRNCELASNPLHAELTEMAAAVGCDFCVNAVIDAERRLGGIFAGDLVLAHSSACEFARRYATIDAGKRFEIVVTTAAGYPLDTTYYQAVKGLVGALGILAPGGSIILAAECCNGLGSNEFRQSLERLFKLGEYDEFLRHISNPDNFAIDQWEVEMLVKALRKGKIYLFSKGIAESDRPLTHATVIDSVEQGISLALADAGGSARMAVIPEGPYIIPSSDMI